MTFENRDIEVIAPMDPTKARRYVEPVRDEVVKGWDHVDNILEDYIYSTVDVELGWCNSNSTFFDSDDALENWKNRMNEVSLRKCGLITQSLCRVTIETIELPIYEGILDLSEFLLEFEDKVS